MAASSNMKRNYHVFLSFRGPDVRHGFLSHLYAALDQRGIHTFVDREELRKGEEISPTLVRAIEESRIAIIVFSENYASSPWCLEELLKIMECRERMGLMVFPVFYKVEPREVRGGRESYKRAMAKHESKFGKDSEKVKRWKKALLDAGSLSGWHFNDRDERDEAELIQSIVKELSIFLRPRSLDVAKYPVDIESRVQELISLSESAGSDVLMIGLWGPGGIGKTTIAKALYNAIHTQFQGCCFLAQVREKSNQSSGRVALQKQLLSEILPHKELTFYDVDRGISLIQERLCCKKVLVVLDDVDDMDQLNALAGKGDWFGKGSRIIVTSRNKHLLTYDGRICMYEVRNLEYDKAQDLLSQHAFANSKSVEIRMELIDKALHYANGLPLALEVLGSFLRGRNIATWESALHKLSKSPDQTINRVLKTSFDGLEKNEREIFLDIACFFKGKKIEYIKGVLDDSGFETTIGIDILIERCLIKNENGILQMHDLIQLMGKDIVNQEGPNDPRKRSRLWLFEDVQDVLYEEMGMDAVNAIVLDLLTPEEITISPGAFTNIKRLRMLILRGVHISSQGPPIHLPNTLRCLEWSNAPDLEFGPGRKKLKRLHLKHSHIKQLRGICQNFINLKSIKFKDCKFLASVPDFSSIPNLESLHILMCGSLVEVHPSVGCLDKLKYLRISNCSSLRIFPNVKAKSLQYFHLSDCCKLEKCPDIPEKMEHLKMFVISKMAIKELPASIENLVSVHTIQLDCCNDLTRLPSSIRNLKNLKILYLWDCSNLAMFPKYLEDSIDPDGDLGFPNLRWLDLSGCNLSEAEFLENASSCPKFTFLNLSNNKFTHLPTCFNKYDHWKDLFVYSCKQSKGVSVDDVSSPKVVKILANGREMPEWILPCEVDSISFMIPPDLCDEFLGLALCFIDGQYKEGSGIFFFLDIYVNGKIRYHDFVSAKPMESDHVSLFYIPRGDISGEEKLLRNDWKHIQVCRTCMLGSKKKQGLRLICKQQEDDLRVSFPTLSADGNELEFQGRILERKSISNGI